MTKARYQIYYDESKDCVAMDWDGYLTSTQFKEGTEMMLTLVEANKTSKVLADMKDLVLISMEDQFWVVNEFLPRLNEAGVKMLAVVNPHYYYGKVAVESLTVKTNETSIACKIFHNLETAKQWLARTVEN
ncbi:STAS/SEC14 domain-containing protein [Desertivirga brevis]|uniref:STAS/SEC14 domain-containing protein n=1 Tax=Desertivirga brevis TaxID=2810310 RepID=UPI001A97692B|nr:STAS/SEC14 domain-containing protein [Pedobacter sp. SYSU D00873]